jgi:hypothetical protein
MFGGFDRSLLIMPTAPQTHLRTTRRCCSVRASKDPKLKTRHQESTVAIKNDELNILYYTTRGRLRGHGSLPAYLSNLILSGSSSEYTSIEDLDEWDFEGPICYNGVF